MPGHFVAEVWSELAIGLAVIGLRVYTRVSTLSRKLAWDDALMLAAGLAYIAESTAAYFVGAYWHGLANSGMTEEQRKTIDPQSDEYRLRVNGSKTHVVGWFMYTTLMWLLKACWLLFYSRLTDGVYQMHIRIRVGYGLVAATYLAAILVIIFKCYPIHKQWQITPNPGNNCQPGFSTLQVSFIMAINTATDLYLMAIPLPMIYKSGLQTRRKAVLLILFSGGFIVIIFGILRCVTLLTLGAIDPAQSGEWSVRESFVAVIVSNLPMIFPLMQSLYRKVRGLDTKNSSTDPHYQLSSAPRGSKRSKNFMHPLSVPNDTAWGSDEAIVLSENRDKLGATTSVTKGNYNTSSESMEDGMQTNSEARASVPTGTEHGKNGAGVNYRASNENRQIMVVEEYSVEGSPKREGEGLHQYAPFAHTYTAGVVS